MIKDRMKLCCKNSETRYLRNLFSYQAKRLEIPLTSISLHFITVSDCSISSTDAKIAYARAMINCLSQP